MFLGKPFRFHCNDHRNFFCLFPIGVILCNVLLIHRMIYNNRWKHTAVALDDDRILIFGGLADKNKRFNDVWIFTISAGCV